MCPSFSLCAWRILKMRSCLRRPLVPGISRVRAMRLSSVMFFSLSSAMVMITYTKAGCFVVGCGGGSAPEEKTDGQSKVHPAQTGTARQADRCSRAPGRGDLIDGEMPWIRYGTQF